MKSILFLCLALVASSAFASERSESPKIYGSLSTDGRLILVPYGEANEYLAYFKGFDNFADPVARLYRKENSGNSTDAHYYRLVGTETINIQNKKGSVLVHGSLIPYIEVVDGTGEKTKMIFLEKGGAFEADKVVAQYQKYQNIVPSFVEAKKAVAAGQARVQKSCGGALAVTINWDAFAAKENRSIPGMLLGHLDALTRLCETDADYKKAAGAINEIRLTTDDTSRSHEVTVTGNIITVSLHADAVNVPDTAYEKFQQAL